MAKTKVPPGVAGMSEKEVSEMINKSSGSNNSAMKQLIESLRAQNTNKSTVPVNIASKSQAIADNQARQLQQKQLKQSTDDNKKLLESDSDLLKAEEKLTTVVEKLIGVFEKSLTKGVGPVTTTARAQELVDSKKLDYRSIGQRFKDKIFGRGGTDAEGKRIGNAFDPNSLRYKFTTMKGLAETTGLVNPNSTGFVANALAKRQERKQTALEMSNLNPQMKNLKQFGYKDPITGKHVGDEAKVRAYYERETGKAQVATGKLQDKEALLNKARAAGIAEDEITRTTGGKRALKARNTAADEVINLDPRMRGEKKENEAVRKVREAEAEVKAVTQPKVEPKAEPAPKKVTKENLTPFAGPAAAVAKATEATNDRAKEDAERVAKQMDDQTKLLKDIEANTRGAGKGKAEKKQKEAEEKKGGVLSGMMDSAKNLVGGKKGGMLGRIAKTGSNYLGKVGGIGKLAKGFGVGAIASLAGEGLQAGGDKLKDAGYEKTGKAVSTAGTAAKYAGYGAMIGSVVPGVGTAIGGAVGGVIGAGKGIYDNYFKGGATGAVKSKTIKESGEYDLHMDPDTGKFMANGKEISGEEYTRLQNMPMGMDKVRAVAAAANNADKVANASAENDGMKMSKSKSGDVTQVNAPTNINKVTQNQMSKRTARPYDYWQSRYTHKGAMPAIMPM